jgi:hypothetical protein
MILRLKVMWTQVWVYVIMYDFSIDMDFLTSDELNKFEINGENV